MKRKLSILLCGTLAKGNVYKGGSNFYFESSQSGYHSGTQGGSFFGWNTLSSTNNTYGGSSFSSDNDPCEIGRAHV